MELKKRNCSIIAEIETNNSYYEVFIDFGDRKIEFKVSKLLGDKIGEFVSALYTLYHEGEDFHGEWHHKYQFDNNNQITATTTEIDWDSEGHILTIQMTKMVDDATIFIRTTEDYGRNWDSFSVDGRDFCYAIGKACTKALKKYGFYGFQCGMEYIRAVPSAIIIHQLLFIKAYGLGNMETRELINFNDIPYCYKTNFEKELELLLFDM